MEKMEHKICLDTDFLINFLRNKKEEVEFIKQNEIDKEISTTLINLFELYYGAYKSDNKEANLRSISLLLNRINILNLSNNSVKKAGEILAKLEKQGKLIDFRDLFIGTIALTEGFTIKTENKTHFSRILGMK